jgi:hypothetical protein
MVIWLIIWCLASMVLLGDLLILPSMGQRRTIVYAVALILAFGSYFGSMYYVSRVITHEKQVVQGFQRSSEQFRTGKGLSRSEKLDSL